MLSNSKIADYAWGLPNQFNSHWLWVLRLLIALFTLLVTRNLAGIYPCGLVIWTVVYAYLMRAWMIKFSATNGGLLGRCLGTFPITLLAVLVPNTGMFLTYLVVEKAQITTHMATIYSASMSLQLIVLGVVVPFLWCGKSSILPTMPKVRIAQWSFLLLVVTVAAFAITLFYSSSPATTGQRGYPSWKEVASSVEYQGMSIHERERVRADYFLNNVAPQVPPHDLEMARKEFYSDTAPMQNEGQ